MVLVDFARPEPWQIGHGSSTTMPRPRQSRHGSVTANTPPEAEVCMPLPSQVGQTRGTVPALAPVPRQASQAASDTICMPTVTPAMLSVKSTVTSPSTSLPRLGPRLVEKRCVRVPVVPPAPPKSPPNRSPIPPSAPAPLRNRSSTDGPPGVRPPEPGKRKPPPPNSRRASSYSLRLSALESTSLASETSLNRCSAAGLPGFWSGWLSRASLR